MTNLYNVKSIHLNGKCVNSIDNKQIILPMSKDDESNLNSKNLLTEKSLPLCYDINKTNPNINEIVTTQSLKDFKASENDLVIPTMILNNNYYGHLEGEEINNRYIEYESGIELNSVYTTSDNVLAYKHYDVNTNPIDVAAASRYGILNLNPNVMNNEYYKDDNDINDNDINVWTIINKNTDDEKIKIIYISDSEIKNIILPRAYYHIKHTLKFNDEYCNLYSETNGSYFRVKKDFEDIIDNNGNSIIPNNINITNINYFDIYVKYVNDNDNNVKQWSIIYDHDDEKYTVNYDEDMQGPISVKMKDGYIITVDKVPIIGFNNHFNYMISISEPENILSLNDIDKPTELDSYVDSNGVLSLFINDDYVQLQYVYNLTTDKIYSTDLNLNIDKTYVGNISTNQVYSKGPIILSERSLVENVYGFKFKLYKLLIRSTLSIKYNYTDSGNYNQYTDDLVYIIHIACFENNEAISKIKSYYGFIPKYISVDGIQYQIIYKNCDIKFNSTRLIVGNNVNPTNIKGISGITKYLDKFIKYDNSKYKSVETKKIITFEDK